MILGFHWLPYNNLFLAYLTLCRVLCQLNAQIIPKFVVNNTLPSRTLLFVLTHFSKIAIVG